MKPGMRVERGATAGGVLAVPPFWREGERGDGGRPVVAPLRLGERVADRDLFGGVGDLPLFAVASYRTEGAT